MVMKRNVMAKNLFQTIRRSLGRYIAIVAIIALGAGMFVGLLTTKSDMLATAQKYVDQQNMFHLNLLNTYGWSDKELEAISGLPQVKDAQGVVTLDVIARYDETGEDKVYRLHTIPETVDKVYLLGGRMPERPDECLADGSGWGDEVLGMQFIVSDTNEEDTLEAMERKVFTVVGYVSTPLYMDMTRGTTTIGNGSLTSYVYIPEDALNVDYYTQISITLPEQYEVYSEELKQALEAAADDLEPDVEKLAKSRFQQLKSNAQAEYADGLAEYEDGKAEYEDGRAEAIEGFEEALLELRKGQHEIDKNRAELQKGEEELKKGEETLAESEAALNTSRQELSDAKAAAYEEMSKAYDELMANYKTAVLGQQQINTGLEKLNSGIAQLESGLTQLAEGLQQLELLIGVLETGVEMTQGIIDLEKQSLIPNEERIAKLEEELASQKKQLEDSVAQRDDLLEQQATYTRQLEDLKTQQAEVQKQKEEVDSGVTQLELGMMELETKQLQAENQFSAAESQIDAGQVQLEAGKKELEANKLKLEQGKLELEEAQRTLNEGLREFEAEKKKIGKELTDAAEELSDAQTQLADAKETIDTMEPPEVFILDRNTNPGYVAVNSNSDIVAGVSRVFPAFFLLIAALVCITTLTKMVDEERTQIGVLKALGYGSGAIMWKYLFYCGSAAILGCGLGVAIGSVVFPMILWGAYGIILNLMPQVVLKLNWPLCLAVVAAYTAVSLFVTWLCCHKELKEVPAQLIRPKAPTPGKKIWMEYLPFWKKISFLNKVMFRNVFRYRQRLFMMLVGIGGCTALLLTGFGLRDSIVGIVDQQFDEITVYDMEVYFAEGKSEAQQEAFREELRGDVDRMLFYHRTSVDLLYKDRSREVSIIAPQEALTDFVDMHDGKKQLPMPEVGEVMLSVGAADAMGIHEGDQIVLRNSDMKQLNVTVAGVFDNYVQNFVIISPETIRQQWKVEPELQMALINVRETQDVHEAGAKIAAMDGVMTVSISQDVADQVNAMLGALDLVVITVVICAALLAVIVLYNLTNISITERIREIATIKVLGFNSVETGLYVFKENLFLTAMGAVLGLGGGVALLSFVMSQIKIDMVWFEARLSFPSYIWGLLLTMVTACLVDFLLYFKLEKINMAEALKSVE